MKQLWFWVITLWCRNMHPAMWPAHGYYRCAKCMRIYEVPWAAPQYNTVSARVQPSMTPGAGVRLPAVTSVH